MMSTRFGQSKRECLVGSVASQINTLLVIKSVGERNSQMCLAFASLKLK
jgi:hypothetical protein